MTERAEQDPISTPAMLRQFASGYLARADPKTPLASPLFASLSGLPPLLIQVGTADLLLSDSERLATAAAQAGVNVILEIGGACVAPATIPCCAGQSGLNRGPFCGASVKDGVMFRSTEHARELGLTGLRGRLLAPPTV